MLDLNMITLTYMNGKVSVWNANDWLKIREEHRIVGSLIGCLANLPRQDSFLGLPMILLPEEATLLLEKKLACLLSYPSLSHGPSSEIKQKFEQYRKTMYKDQVECFKEERKRQVTSMIDHIVEGKQKKLMGHASKRKKTTDDETSPSEESHSEKEKTETDIIDREALLKEELDKIKSIDESSTLVQTFTASPWLNKEEASPVEWDYPKTNIERLRYKTFRDLWEKGHYLTSGQKFGADFLVYPGDPVKFHAQFLVICIEDNCTLSATDLVALGRLGSSVRKTVVLASLSEDGNNLMYQSLQWNGSF